MLAEFRLSFRYWPLLPLAVGEAFVSSVRNCPLLYGEVSFVGAFRGSIMSVGVAHPPTELPPSRRTNWLLADHPGSVITGLGTVLAAVIAKLAASLPIASWMAAFVVVLSTDGAE